MKITYVLNGVTITIPKATLDRANSFVNNIISTMSDLSTLEVNIHAALEFAKISSRNLAALGLHAERIYLNFQNKRNYQENSSILLLWLLTYLEKQGVKFKKSISGKWPKIQRDPNDEFILHLLEKVEEVTPNLLPTQ